VTDQDKLVALGVAILIGLISLSVYRRRDFIRQHIRYYLSTAIAYVFVFWIATRFMDPPKALLLSLLIYAIVLNRWRPRRSRYISRRERRKVIARFERSGKRYDPKKHEIDHVVPHSRGGTNTADNLKVIDRDRNREKSAKSPWWDVLGR